MKLFTKSLVLTILSTVLGYGTANADVCGGSCQPTRHVIQCDCYVENDDQLVFLDSIIGSNQRGSNAYSVAQATCEARAWKYGAGIIKDCHDI